MQYEAGKEGKEGRDALVIFFAGRGAIVAGGVGAAVDGNTLFAEGTEVGCFVAGRSHGFCDVIVRVHRLIVHVVLIGHQGADD